MRFFHRIMLCGVLGLCFFGLSAQNLQAGNYPYAYSYYGGTRSMVLPGASFGTVYSPYSYVQPYTYRPAAYGPYYGGYGVGAIQTQIGYSYRPYVYPGASFVNSRLGFQPLVQPYIPSYAPYYYGVSPASYTYGITPASYYYNVAPAASITTVNRYARTRPAFSTKSVRTVRTQSLVPGISNAKMRRIVNRR